MLSFARQLSKRFARWREVHDGGGMEKGVKREREKEEKDRKNEREARALCASTIRCHKSP